MYFPKIDSPTLEIEAARSIFFLSYKLIVLCQANASKIKPKNKNKIDPSNFQLE
jgi:hypothetical protein